MKTGQSEPVRPWLKLILGAAVVLGLIALFYLATVNRGPGSVDAAKIFAAAQAYTREVRAEGFRVPPTVTLRELLARRLIKPEDVSGFKDVEVTVFLTTSEKKPDAVLMEAEFPDGHRMQVLADGSISEGPKK